MILYGILIIVSMLIGVSIGFRLRNNEKPIGNLVKLVNDGIIEPLKESHLANQEFKDEKRELQKLSAVAKNVDVYNGTNEGQKRVK